ncbi:MAG: B12-binding domain-containing radical SAM protein [Bryobacteraceae bacterium]|nr:B12-binding domain-containing radical SAM protein [Bryobacteraceae bacterium]
MSVHIVNPSDTAFGIAVITPRWLYVIAAATPGKYGDPVIWDETLSPLDPEQIQPGDVVGIGIHTGNALRGYALGRIARERGAWVVFGGIHPTLYAEESFELGGAHAVVRGDGDQIWASVIADCLAGTPRQLYEGGRVSGDQFKPARWDLLPPDSYMWASVQTVRGCAKHCSFCSVWRTDGQKPRQRTADAVIDELIELRRKGFRFIALADDNFYPVSFKDIELARRQKNEGEIARLEGIRKERFELMERLAELPRDMVFFTQITMEAAEDPAFLDAMKKARIKGALVGVEAVTAEGLKSVYKDFNVSGDELIERLKTFSRHGVHVLGSFIFGLPSDRPDTFGATQDLARQAGLTFAQFVMLTPFPGTVDFEKWEKSLGPNPPTVEGIPITRYWLVPADKRPKMFMPHPTMSSEELRLSTQGVWDSFYSWSAVWRRSACTPNFRARLAFIFISKLYRQMYATTGIATDSARRSRATEWARWLAKPTQKLFQAKPLPDLQAPRRSAMQEVTTDVASSLKVLR